MKKLLLIILLAITCNAVYAQQDAFCRSVDTLLTDAAVRFKYSRDSMYDINESGAAWQCRVHVPGVIAARILSVMGLYYEGALYQTTKLENLKPVYEQYKAWLNNCLGTKGYEISYGENVTKGLGDYKKVMYMPAVKDEDMGDKPPPHASLEVGYYKENGTYTLILYVFTN